ncbi:NusA N-terminal domain-containing protein [Mesomycoplasma neurolyticum]|uniref:Transcription elongation protein nusA n=1 Tax=Mesomycoplasma neurolyticum TaxID=2120 RepID=A0A449A6D5_9BACT|nr:NusA N-terminal domain-containing protein [Mesomycoplasma neurolyticum]VEU59821.1 Transcription elongation protein nusA [Mesomycoplasma neurolyticum]
MQKNILFFKSFKEISNSKNINIEEIIDILKEIFKKTITSRIDPDSEIDLFVDLENNDLRILNHNFTVVSEEEFEEESKQEGYKLYYTTKEIAKSRNNLVVSEGDVNVTMEIDPKDIPKDIFISIRQQFTQKVNEISREKIYKKYHSLIGQVVKAKFISAKKSGKTYEIIEDGTLAFMPNYLSSSKKIEDTLNKNSLNIEDVYIFDALETSKGSQVIISNTSNKILFDILQKEIPEITTNEIKIDKVARIANERSKVAVSAVNEENVPNILGAIIGQGGNRIEIISQHLNDEKIDVVLYSKNKETFISNSLAPARVVSIISQGPKKTKYKVVVPDSQHTLAIGKKGINVLLAAELVNAKLDIMSYSEAIKELGSDKIVWNGNISDIDELNQIEAEAKSKTEILQFKNKSNNRNKNNKMFTSYLMEEFDKEIEQFNEDFKFSSDYTYSFSEDELELDETEETQQYFEEEIIADEPEREIKKEIFTKEDIQQINKEIKNYKYDNDLNEFAGVKEIDINWDDEDWGEN